MRKRQPNLSIFKKKPASRANSKIISFGEDHIIIAKRIRQQEEKPLVEPPKTLTDVINAFTDE